MTGRERRFHRVFLRTSRGGSGVPFESALAELAAVFAPDEWRVGEVHRAFSFVDGWLSVAEPALARRLARLGYTAAVVEITVREGAGREAPPMRRRAATRWASGAERRGEDLHVSRVVLDLDALPRPDDEAMGRAPPGHGVRRRRMSGLDARFVANLSGLPDGARALDPFAGRGVLARALLERGLRVLAGEREAFLLPALAALLGGASVDARQSGGVLGADAVRLPLADACVDGIVTEPPFAREGFEEVGWAMDEAVRVIRPGGSLTLLLSVPLAAALAPRLAALGLREEERAPLLRHKQPGLVERWRKPAS